MRKVEGKTLDQLTAAEIFLYKEELSRHRALATLLGDYDRKIDNYIVTADGRLFAIDAGVADVRGERLAFLSRNPDAAYGLFMEGSWGRDHWLSRFYKDEITQGASAQTVELWATDKSAQFSRKGLVAEEALTYQAAKPTVDRISDLMQPGNEQRLRDMLTASYKKMYASDGSIKTWMVDFVEQQRAKGRTLDITQPAVMDQVCQEVVKAKVDASLAAFRTRNARLDECMRGLNDRNAIPLPPADTSRLRLRPTALEQTAWLEIAGDDDVRRAA
jgi:hypothetical protein